MYNSQYYTCEQIDQRLLQGYLDDYNTQNNTNLTKAEFLTLLFNTTDRNNTVDNLVTQIGYYECDTAAGTAAKAITVANYNLFAGGSMKVKFVNKNTANNATLNINSQGAKALYYQGERASSTNSWDEDEVVDIYYDGTNYYANNVKGGSGSGVYDVSVEHPTSGPNEDGKFTLEYILNPSNVNELIPVNKRYPGMSIQFVSTYDNKYVQYRLMAQNFTTDITAWQNMGDFVEEKEHPIADNEVAGYLTDKNKIIIAKLMKSGAVEWLVKNSDITALETAISDEQTRAEGAEGILLGALNELDAHSVKEVSKSTVEENVVSYLTDKDGKILLRIMSNGALEKTAKNSTDIRFEDIEDLLSYVSSEVPDNGNGVIKYLTDKDGKVIATINNVGDTEFKGGGGFDGELSKSRIVGFDAVKVLTGNNNAVVGWITSTGKVHIVEAEFDKIKVSDNTDIGVPEHLLTTIALCSNSRKKRQFVNDASYNLLYAANGKYNKKGWNINLEGAISLIDDDSIDSNLTNSEKTNNNGGFASTLLPLLLSLNKKYSGSIKGELVYGIAAEGQRIGLTPLYGMEDTFNGELNYVGTFIKKLKERCKWDVMCHSMTARYISNSYLVNGLDSEFANSLLIDATYSGTNGLGWETTTCYDTVTKKNYKVKPIPSGSTTSPGWDECPLHYAKPYLAVSKDANSELVINPTYSVKYQVDTWFERAKQTELYTDDYRVTVGWGTSPSIWHMKELFKYSDDCLSSYSSYNTIPLDSNAGRLNVQSAISNVYTASKYKSLLDAINGAKKNNGWCILYNHANTIEFINTYLTGQEYGTETSECGPLGYYDENYNPEWILPLKYTELHSMDENNYWENPPQRLGINDWSEWYPCPGTELAMIYDIIEYAINHKIRFISPINGIREFGNFFNLGVYNPHNSRGSWNADKRMDLTTKEENQSYCIIGADGSIRYFSK